MARPTCVPACLICPRSCRGSGQIAPLLGRRDSRRLQRVLERGEGSKRCPSPGQLKKGWWAGRSPQPHAPQSSSAAGPRRDEGEELPGEEGEGDLFATPEEPGSDGKSRFEAGNSDSSRLPRPATSANRYGLAAREAAGGAQPDMPSSSFVRLADVPIAGGLRRDDQANSGCGGGLPVVPAEASRLPVSVDMLDSAPRVLATGQCGLCARQWKLASSAHQYKECVRPGLGTVCGRTAPSRRGAPPRPRCWARPCRSRWRARPAGVPVLPGPSRPGSATTCCPTGTARSAGPTATQPTPHEAKTPRHRRWHGTHGICGRGRAGGSVGGSQVDKFCRGLSCGGTAMRDGLRNV